MPRRVLGVAVVVLLLAAALVYGQRRSGPLQVSGIIEADEVRVGSRLGGRVAEVLVEEGQQVAAGTVLVRLEPFDLQRRFEEAEANVAARKSELQRLEKGFREEEIGQAAARVERLKNKLKVLEDGPRKEEIEAARARQRLADAQLLRARTTHDRNASLAGKDVSAISRDALDRSQEELRIAESTKEVRDQELRLLEQGNRAEEIAAAQAELAEAQEAWRLTYNGSRREDIERAAATLAAAQAALGAVQVQRDELEIKAPVAGAVEAIDLQPGDLVAPNAPVLSLLDRRKLWVRAYFPENRVALKVGQQLKIQVDSHPGQDFSGVVTYLARQAEFTPSNVQTPDERAQQVFRVKVHLTGPTEELRPGMAATLQLDTK